MDLERAHQIARERGPVMPVYWVVRAILQPFFHVYFRLRRIGLEHIPTEGPVLLAANHRSFSDPFMIGICLGRPLHFVAKIELFDKRWKAWLLLALGAFPIRRGESDEARDGDGARDPRAGRRGRHLPRGHARAARARSASPSAASAGWRSRPARPIVPVAIIGTEDIRRGWRIRPRRVTVRCGRALTLPAPARPRAAPGGRAGDLATASGRASRSSGSGSAACRRSATPSSSAPAAGAPPSRRCLPAAGASVQLGCRTAEQARELGAARAPTIAYLPGVELPDERRTS